MTTEDTCTCDGSGVLFIAADDSRQSGTLQCSCLIRSLLGISDVAESVAASVPRPGDDCLNALVMRYRTALQAIEAWGFHAFRPGDASSGWENQCSVVTPDRMCHCGHPPEKHPLTYEIAAYAQKMLSDGHGPEALACPRPGQADMPRLKNGEPVRVGDLLISDTRSVSGGLVSFAKYTEVRVLALQGGPTGTNLTVESTFWESRRDGKGGGERSTEKEVSDPFYVSGSHYRRAT